MSRRQSYRADFMRDVVNNATSDTGDIRFTYYLDEDFLDSRFRETFFRASRHRQWAAIGAARVDHERWKASRRDFRRLEEPSTAR